MKIVPLFGTGIASDAYVVTRQRRLNVYLEDRPDGDKTRVAVFGTPGLVRFLQATTPLNLPVRGLLGTQTALYLVANNQFQAITTNGTVIASGTLQTQSGQVSMAYSSTQVVIVDGVAAYLYTPATETFTTIGNFPATGARTVTFCSGFFVAEQPGTQQFWVSNAYDGSTWNSLAFASASQGSDNILAVDTLSGNLLVFSQTHMEFWQNAGLTPQPFAPVLSAVNNFGLAAVFSRAYVNNSLCFVAQTREGAIDMVMINGYGAQIISTSDLEAIIEGFSVVSDAVAFAYEVYHHKFYQVTFPTGNRSFLFDTVGGAWSEVQTGPSVIPTRHQANLGTYYAGKTIVSDYATNMLYTLDPTAYTDNGTTIIREVISRHGLSNFNRIRISLLYLDMETGVGTATGQGQNPQIMLQYSKDNGRTWSAERWVSLGASGQYLTRVIWRRFGSTRDAVFRVRMSDPVQFVIANGALKVTERQQ